MPTSRAALEKRVRALCLALPEVVERLSHGEPTYFVRNQKSFCTLMVDGHHKIEFPHLVCAAYPGVQAALVDERPETFFVPAYVGVRGWVGVRLDRDLAWDELEDLLTDAYRVVAPATLVKQLDAS